MAARAREFMNSRAFCATNCTFDLQIVPSRARSTVINGKNNITPIDTTPTTTTTTITCYAIANL